jgi:iron complex outermembrane receptor protein
MNSSVNATFIRDLETVFPDGSVERYDGTLGNNNLTAGTGTPKWKGIWRTTFSTEMYDLTSTLNWTSGYNVSAMDQGNAYRDCGLNDGSVPCRINDYFTWDLNLQAHVRADTALYLTIQNVTDNLPPVDTIATYGLTGYNVVVGGDGMLGRYFKLGVKFDTN